MRSGPAELFAVQAIKAEIFAHGRHKGPIHPLELQAQHHDQITALNALAHIVKHLCAPAIDARRHQGRRADQTYPCAQRLEHGDIGARNPAMGDIAANRHA